MMVKSDGADIENNGRRRSGKSSNISPFYHLPLPWIYKGDLMDYVLHFPVRLHQNKILSLHAIHSHCLVRLGFITVEFWNAVTVISYCGENAIVASAWHDWQDMLHHPADSRYFFLICFCISGKIKACDEYFCLGWCKYHFDIQVLEKKEPISVSTSLDCKTGEQTCFCHITSEWFFSMTHIFLLFFLLALSPLRKAKACPGSSWKACVVGELWASQCFHFVQLWCKWQPNEFVAACILCINW